LAARLLVAAPPRLQKRWTEKETDPIAEQLVCDLFGRLLALEPELNEDGYLRPVVVKMDDEAKAM